MKSGISKLPSIPLPTTVPHDSYEDYLMDGKSKTEHGRFAARVLQPGLYPDLKEGREYTNDGAKKRGRYYATTDANYIIALTHFR